MYGMNGGPGTSDPERITWWDVNVRGLIGYALDVPSGRISGPAWLGSEYDITAQLPARATDRQLRQMLADLLADRFGLVFHRVPKEMTVYELTVASGGPKFGPSPETPTEGVPMPFRASFEDGVMHMTFHRSSIFFLINRLTSVLQGGGDSMTPVADKTGLTGNFDFKLDLLMAPSSEPTGAPEPQPYVDPKAASAALEKQLGLTLRPIRQNVDFIVVDRLNKTPTDN
jgi:uncharacterized protein (TIGR03435 family)